MSVIFGIKENNRIIIAGDKRGSSIDGKTLSDDLDKVLMINDHLAFSSAGNAAIEKAISIHSRLPPESPRRWWRWAHCAGDF